MATLIVGLGNPGPEYEATRHNAGFLVIDALADTLGASYWKVLCGASVATVKRKEHEVILAKPQSFMNRSGGPVKLLCSEFDIDPTRNLVIVHDELDIPVGEVRFKYGGGHAGHNGLRSIHEKLGTDNYARIRIGIGRPPGRMNAADFVLAPLKGASAEEFCATIDRGETLAMKLVDSGIDALRGGSFV